MTATLLISLASEQGKLVAPIGCLGHVRTGVKPKVKEPLPMSSFNSPSQILLLSLRASSCRSSMTSASSVKEGGQVDMLTSEDWSCRHAWISALGSTGAVEVSTSGPPGVGQLAAPARTRSGLQVRDHHGRGCTTVRTLWW